MDEQLSLLGIEAPARPTDRLFFAIFPEPGAAAQIASLGRELRERQGLTGKLLDTGRFHVTLHHLGDHAGVRQDIVASAEKAAAAVARQAKPFDVVFDRVVSFAGRPGKRPLVLRGDDSAGLADLRALQQALGVAMAAAGLGSWAEPRFTPHVTLLYDARELAQQGVEPIRWTVGELVLVHSLLGRTTYIPLGRWPLMQAKERS